MDSDIDFMQVNPTIKSLYAFLKKYDIENFLLTKDFEIALMEINLDEQWDKMRRIVVEKSEVNILIPGYTGYVDEAFKYMLNLLFLKTKNAFLVILNQILKSIRGFYFRKQRKNY